MLQMRSQESYLDYKMQEMPRQPNEAKEPDAGSQEVSKASMSLRVSQHMLRVPLFKYKQSQYVNNLLPLGGIFEKNHHLSIICIISSKDGQLFADRLFL